MKKLIYTSLFYILIVQQLFSQESVNGFIKSEVDQIAIENVNLYLGDEYGTSTNENGYYELKITSTYLDSIVNISAIGFKTIKIKLSYLIENPNIFLEEDVFSLKEVVISPINALPIIKKSYKNNKKNYTTGWLSAKVKVTQFLFVEFDSLINQKQFLGKMEIDGQINFKGYRLNDNLKWQIDYVKATRDFLKYDTIKKPPFNKKPLSLNLYDFFNKYDFSRNSKNGLGFILDDNFSKKYRKVIDFDTLNNRKNYLVKTKPLKSSSSSYNNQKDYKKINNQYQKIKKNLAESIPEFNNRNEKTNDSIINNLIKNSGFQKDELGYAWIDFENYVATRLFYKTEMYTKSGNPFNRLHRDITYQPHKDYYVPQALEVLFKVFSLKGVNIYRYVKITFSDYGDNKNFVKLNASEILEKNHSIKPITINKIIQENKALDEFLLLQKSNFLKPFLKPLRKTINFPLDDFLLN